MQISEGLSAFGGVSAAGSTGCCGSTEGHLIPCYRTQRAFPEEAASQLRVKSVVQLHGERLWEECGRYREGWVNACVGES